MIKYDQSPKCSFIYLSSMKLWLICLYFKAHDCFIIEVFHLKVSVWSRSCFFFFFHVASEHMKYFRKMPTHSHLVLTVKHFHKVSLGFWYKVISQKQKSISCHYNFLLVSLKEIIDNEAFDSGRVTWKTNNCHIDTVEHCLRKWSMALCTLRVNFK